MGWAGHVARKGRGLYLFFHVTDDKRLHGFVEPPLLQENAGEVCDVVAIDHRTEANSRAEITATAGRVRDIYEILVCGQ